MKNLTTSIEIIKNINGVISTCLCGVFNERLIVNVKSEEVASNDIYGKLLDSGFYGKNKVLSFNYGHHYNGKYIAVYDVILNNV